MKNFNFYGYILTHLFPLHQTSRMPSSVLGFLVALSAAPALSDGSQVGFRGQIGHALSAAKSSNIAWDILKFIAANHFAHTFTVIPAT